MPGIPDDIREAIAIANAKSIAEQPAMLANLLYANLINNVNLSQQNAISNQQAMNQLTVSVISKAVSKISSLNPKEAVSVTKVTSAKGLAEQIAQLKDVFGKNLII
jgi:hypothetical protein